MQSAQGRQPPELRRFACGEWSPLAAPRVLAKSVLISATAQVLDAVIAETLAPEAMMERLLKDHEVGR
jgi:hypothetical protein